MTHNSISGLTEALAPILSFTEGATAILDAALLRNQGIDDLVFTAVFAKDEETKQYARTVIRDLAKQLGIYSASIYSFYKAIGNGTVAQTFTVPAFNIRALTYDTTRLLFQLTKEKDLGPYVLEIARSEIDYTAQQPDEYTVVIFAAAIKEGYTGPIFLQGDHYQLSARRFKEDATQEVEKIKSLIDTSLAAEFYNIDIDASTLVELDKPTLDEQQKTNYEVTATLTEHIRSKQLENVVISIGAEIGHIGGKNSTPDELRAFMKGYTTLLPTTITGISKVSVQTGTSHGGVPLPDGTMATVQIDFDVLAQTGAVARDDFHIGGVVQHGASTLPNDLFDHFPKNKTLEIHLATGFQNIVYDTLPEGLKEDMYAWIEKECKAEWEEGWTKEQFLYKTRKKAIGPFKEALWSLSEEEKAPIRQALTEQFLLLFEKLHIVGTRPLLTPYV